MAITIPTTGSGTQTPQVATESHGTAGHFQLIKLTDGNVGSLSPVGTSSNPIFSQFASPPSFVGSVFNTAVGGSLSALVQGSLTAYQGNAPWAFTGSVYATGSLFASQAGSLPWCVCGTVTIQGDVAHGSLDSVLSFPIKFGGISTGNSAFPVAVSSGARVTAIFDPFGRQIVTQAPYDVQVHKSADYAGTQSGTIVWSPNPGKSPALTSLRLNAGSGNAGVVSVYFASSARGALAQYTVNSGVAAWRGEMAPSTTVKPGLIQNWTYPLRGQANDSLRIACTNSMQIYLQVEGFEI